MVVNLQAGQSTTVNKTLHLDALPGAADIIIAIDTTGSMGDAIAQAKAQATALCTDVQAQIPGARFAVMDFRDIPDRPATNGVLILTPTFTSSCAAVLAAVNTMAAGGGGDFAEAYNPTFRAAWADPVLNASRNPNAVQFLVVLGDAPPHNTPAIPAFSACGNQPPADPGMTSTSEIASLNAAEITLLMIHYSTPGNIPIACYNQLAGATGGTAVESGGDLSADIISQIQTAAADIDQVVLIVYGPGLPDPGRAEDHLQPAEPAPVWAVHGSCEHQLQETILAPTVPGNLHVHGDRDRRRHAAGDPDVNADRHARAAGDADAHSAPDTNPLDAALRHRDVVDQFGNPMPGRRCASPCPAWEPGRGAVVTNASGDAQFCYVGPLAPVTTPSRRSPARTRRVRRRVRAERQCDQHWIDITPPTGSCSQGPNPAGHTPPAGDNPSSGQNPDGFYVLNVTDNADPNPQIFIHDSDSAAVFGPFANGTTIKLIQAPGATPSQKPGSRRRGLEDQAERRRTALLRRRIRQHLGACHVPRAASAEVVDTGKRRNSRARSGGPSALTDGGSHHVERRLDPVSRVPPSKTQERTLRHASKKDTADFDILTKTPERLVSSQSETKEADGNSPLFFGSRCRD